MSENPGIRRTPYSTPTKISLGLSAVVCIPMPWVWLLNVSARSEIPFTAILMGHRPALLMSALASLALVAAVVRARQTVAFLFAAAALPVVVAMRLGTLASDGVFLGLVLLVASALLVARSQRTPTA